MEKSSSFPAIYVKYPLAGIPAPLRRSLLWVTKARSTPFHIFMNIHLRTPTPKKYSAKKKVCAKQVRILNIYLNEVHQEDQAQFGQ